MIPRLIHLYWGDPTGLDGPLPADVAGNVSEWARLHPDFDVRVWTAAELRELLADFHGLSVYAAMQACRFQSTRSNLARLALLLEYGGFYSDLKNRPLRPFLEDLRPIAAAIITEHPPTIPDYRGRIANAFLGSVPGHTLWRSALKRGVRNVEARRRLSSISLTGIATLEQAMGSRILRTLLTDVPGAFADSDAHGTRLVGKVDFVVIPSSVAWGTLDGSDGWMERTAVSYNNEQTPHWYQRAQTESIYVDEPSYGESA